jgi:pyruvate,water dikinase
MLCVVRNNIIELMADPLTPLFGTLGRAAINASFGRIMEKFFGRPGVIPEEVIVTVNGYAYYNGSLKLRDVLRIFLGSPGIMKRMFTGAVERWTEIGRPNYLAAVERWQAARWQDLPAVDILGAVRELTEAAIDAYGALVSGVIPAAWISEGLFTFVYNTLIKRRTDPPAPVFLMGLTACRFCREVAV